MRHKPPKTQAEISAALLRCQKANARFTDSDIWRIREACERPGVHYKDIAKAWGCGVQTVERIHKRLTYIFVPEKGQEVEKMPEERAEYTVLEEVPETTPEERQARDRLLKERMIRDGLATKLPTALQPGTETPEEIERRAGEEADQRDAVALAVGAGK